MSKNSHNPGHATPQPAANSSLQATALEDQLESFATAMQRVSEAIEVKRLLLPGALAVDPRQITVDPGVFDVEILKALDQAEQVLNPARYPFTDARRKEFLHAIFAGFSWRTILAVSSSKLLRLHDRLLERFGVQQQISTGIILPDDTWPYDSFLWRIDLPMPSLRFQQKLSATAEIVLANTVGNLGRESEMADGLGQRPKWDKDRRELWYGGKLSKSFRKQARNQESILDAFEEQQWVARTDDPIAGPSRGNRRQRLADAVRKLNRNNIWLLFKRDGSGDGVQWFPKPQSIDRP